MNGDNLDELNPHLPKHQWHFKLWVLILKATSILIYCFTWKLECWAKTEYWDFAPKPYSGNLWVDILTLLGPTMWWLITILSSCKWQMYSKANLIISDYSCTFDESYSLLKSDDADHNLQLFLFGFLQKSLYKPISCWLILSKGLLFILASAESKSTLCWFQLTLRYMSISKNARWDYMKNYCWACVFWRGLSKPLHTERPHSVWRSV